MKTIGRDKVRGKPLNHDCYSARISRHEFGMDDPRVFCFGLYTEMGDDIQTDCVTCKAYVGNAKPPKEEN